MEQPLIPANEKGKQNDVETARKLSAPAEARKVFTRACKRLMNPKVWSGLAGNEKAGFSLVDAKGKALHRLIRQKDFIRINVPGPGPGTGGGFDWVQVALVDDRRIRSARNESLAIRLDVCANPLNTETQAAHFFENGASSSFEIIRDGNRVVAAHHGRNEQINNHTGRIMDNIRNTIIGVGAMLGLSELQWKTLIEGFLKDEIGG